MKRSPSLLSNHSAGHEPELARPFVALVSRHPHRCGRDGIVDDVDAGGAYREFRVAPSPGTSGAGPLRVVVDDNTGSMYYTWTHYGDGGSPAFVQIR